MPVVGEDLSDVWLVNRLTTGDTSVFATFYDRYSRLIRHCILKRTNLSPDDILQAFFAKLHETGYRALNGWERQSRLSGYLAHIVKNFVIDEWKKANPRLKAETAAHPDDPDPRDNGPGPDAPRDRRELRRQSVRAWSKLEKPRDRQLICGKFHREIPAHTAATAMGLSDGTYRKAMFDAQNRFKAHFRALAPEYFS